MKTVENTSFLEREMRSLLVVCKQLDRGNSKLLRIDLKGGFLERESSFPEEQKQKLLELSHDHPTECVEMLVETRLQGEKLLDFSRGGKTLLPAKFRRFYENCVAFHTNDFDLYFADCAITRFQDTIFRLDRRTIGDSLAYATEMVQSGQVQNMSLALLSGFSYWEGRYCELSLGDKNLSLLPGNTFYYHVYLNEDGTINPMDVENILKMIDLFATQLGPYEEIRWNQKECVAYNRGSLKLDGIDKAPEVLQKVFSYVK